MTIISPDGTSPRAVGTATKQPLLDTKRPSLPGEAQRQAWRKAMEAEQAASWFRRADGVREPPSQVRDVSLPAAAALGRPAADGDDRFPVSSTSGRAAAGESGGIDSQGSTSEVAARPGAATSARSRNTGVVASVAPDSSVRAGAAIDPGFKRAQFSVAPLPQLAAAGRLENIYVAETPNTRCGPAPRESSTPAIQWRPQTGSERAVDANASDEVAVAKATASATRDRNAAAFDRASDNADRVRVTWSRFGDASGTGVQVWLGASRSVQANVPVLASQIARVLKNAGVRLVGVVVNGRPMEARLQSGHDEASPEVRDEAIHSRRNQWQISER